MPFDTLAVTRTEQRRRITAATRAPEPDCVRALLPEATLDTARCEAIAATAARLVASVRDGRRSASGVDALMAEFSLSSREGVALMCLAEALLRIPDRATADRLIRDKIARGDWRAHVGQSPSLFVNAAAWGLLITGRLVGTASAAGLGAALTRLIARGGEPLIRAGVDLAMRLLGRQFVLGETIADALHHARPRERQGYRFSYDMLGEAALTAPDAHRYLRDYEHAIDAIGAAATGAGAVERPGISVKLSALHPRYARGQRARVIAELLPRLTGLCVRAASHGIGLNIDAEEADRLDLSLDLLDALAGAPDLAVWDGLGFVVQAYQKRAPHVIDWIAARAQDAGRRIMVRLVKGAYWDSEIKRAQEAGLDDYPVYTRKVHTDVSYLACARRMLAAPAAIYPQFATHNAHTVAWLRHAGEGIAWEFQCLHGMGETLYDQVVGDPGFGRICRIYAPVGTHETLLAYLVRRLLENGANSSFVNRVVDPAISIEELVRDPVEQAKETGGAPHPRIPAPRAILAPEREASRGLDLADESVLARLADDLVTVQVEPLPEDAHPSNVAVAVGRAVASGWGGVAVAERAAILERAAGLFEAARPALMRIAVEEAGKTLPNAVGEVREAVDFLRYYAARGRADLQDATPLGPVVCISPWNFPLAIFTGQVAAALAAGNPVLAKPAEQTPRMAAAAVRLLHAAGVPMDALQLLPGAGETVGAALTGDCRVACVVFTGSTDVARAINRALAASGSGARLIAETGGQNAMVVDSSALLEQVVADAVASAFDSAGQRCSALRVLYLQREVAERAIALLRGAMDELRMGDPSLLATDVGPVIDADAAARLRTHVERMRAAARWVHQTPTPDGDRFVPPTACEIDDIGLIGGEVFGPILHVVRYDAADLPRVLDAINATGYGLTFGIHSRIDETIDACVAASHAGNIYVNRTIIGAVVGTQPFGGRGLSGTGPKAGGPLYLHALARGSAPELVDTARPMPSALRALIDALPAFPLGPDIRAEMARVAAADHVRSLSGRSLMLPGPTGEADMLRFGPRGRIGCVAVDLAARLRQMIAAFATGNRAVIAADDAGRALTVALAIPDLVLTLDIAAAGCAAILHAGDDAAAWRRRLAAGDGAIVPLIGPEPDGGYDLRRLVDETTLSVNTTAAGGNASLMTLGG